MKTTNYELSKNLAEIGFKADYEYCYEKHNQTFGLWNKTFEVDCWENENLDNYYPAYDLETLIEALPKQIKQFYFWITYSGSSDCYIIGYIDGIARKTELEVSPEDNQSLADTAARLLILLHEQGLVKFGGENE